MLKINKLSKQICLSSLLLYISFSSIASADISTLNNPVIPGDFPDPSIVKVGDNYWAAATSSEWAPEYPILHSKDLVNWNITGYVFESRPKWTTGNFWAPEISHYKNKYYVYYTAHKKDGPLCVGVATSDKADSGYKDHGPLVCQDAGSIDAMPISDNNGDRYLVWKEDGNSRNQPTPIWAQKFSDDGTKLVGDKKELIRNELNSWEGNLVEAPFIMKHKNMFYMFYSGNACCGRECNYAMGVARSESLLGPWEKNPANPILKANENWKCPGHGSIITDKNDRNFLLYHAYSNKPSGVYVGRQNLVDEVVWNNEWPSINNGKGPSADAGLKYTSANKNKFSFNDEFKGKELGKSWQWPQNAEPAIKLFSRKNGYVQIASKTNKDLSETAGVIAHTIFTPDYTAETLIDLKSIKIKGMAGLSAYGDKENALGLSVQDENLILWKREKNNFQIIKKIPKLVNSSDLYMRMKSVNGDVYSFEYSGDNKSWFQIEDKVEGAFLPPWDRGVRVALTVGGTADAYASFGSFKINPIMEN